MTVTEDPLQDDFYLRLKAFYDLESTYHAGDYMTPERIELVEVTDLVHSEQLVTTETDRRHTLLAWRLIIGEWAFRVVDHFKCSREAVGVFINFLDRCMSSLAQSQNPQLSMPKFHLLASTCLFVALKVSWSEAGSITAADLSTVNRGMFTPEDIIATEREVLKTLQWRLRPPTTHVFLYYFSRLLGTDQKWVTIVQEAKFSIELALLDFELVNHRPPHVVVAALLNAVASGEGDVFTPTDVRVFDEQIRRHALLESPLDVRRIRLCRLRLQDLHNHRANPNNEMIMEQAVVEEERPSSPVSVAVNMFEGPCS